MTHNLSTVLPSLDLLADMKQEDRNPAPSSEVLQENARQLEKLLGDFEVQGKIVNVLTGPVVTVYEFEPASGTRSSRVVALTDDISRTMSMTSVRIADIKGRNIIGIELSNNKPDKIVLKEILSSDNYVQSHDKLPLALGKTVFGDPMIVDLAQMPHLLIAGNPNSGQYAAINAMVLSLLYRFTPEECRLILIDTKKIELSMFNGIPHLHTPVITNSHKAVSALKWAVSEMENRYEIMLKTGFNTIHAYNNGVNVPNFKPLPNIVIIINEIADMMLAAKENVEVLVQRFARLSSSVGIHLIFAAQTQSDEVITSNIKASFSNRISFKMSSKINSRRILGEQGAMELLGSGDMLYKNADGLIQRVHGAYVSDDEVRKVVAHLKMNGLPEYETALENSLNEIMPE